MTRYSPDQSASWEEAPTEIYVPVEQSRPRSWLKILFFGGLLAMLLGGCLLTLLGGYFFVQSDRVLPGVTTFGLDIGMQTRAEALATLENHWRQQTITLVHSGQPVSVTPEQLGMTLNAEDTINHAMTLGRDPDSLFTLMDDGFVVLPSWAYDPAVAEATLQALSAEIDIAPVDAQVRVTNGTVETIAPQNGYQLDVAATLNALNADPRSLLLSQELPLSTIVVTPVVTDVSAVAAEIERLLAHSVTVRGYDPVQDEVREWALTPDVWGQWLTVNGSAEALDWQLDAEAVATYLAGQAEQLGDGRYVKVDEWISAVGDAIATQQLQVNLRIFHSPREHIVQAGESFSSIGRDYGIPYPWVQAANPGVETLSVGQAIVVPSPDEMLPLPVVENKRIVVSISQQRMWAYEDGALKWEWAASTGIDDSPTSPGIFQIQSHEPNAYAGNWDLWMPHFMGIYRPVPTSDFMNGFHGFPTRGNSQLLWTGDLGRKVTYGCVLVSSENAQLLFDWAEEGVVVDVQP